MYICPLPAGSPGLQCDISVDLARHNVIIVNMHTSQQIITLRGLTLAGLSTCSEASVAEGRTCNIYFDCVFCGWRLL